MAALFQVAFIDGGPGMVQAAEHARMLFAVVGQRRKGDLFHQILFLAEVAFDGRNQFAKRHAEMLVAQLLQPRQLLKQRLMRLVDDGNPSAISSFQYDLPMPILQVKSVTVRSGLFQFGRSKGGNP